jgi:subfamily B ATP-binding cassette protein MsbA
MRKYIFGRYLSFGKLFFDRNNSGHLQNTLLNFTSSIAVQLKRLETIVSQLFMLLVYLVIMFMISWKLAVFISIVFPVSRHILRALVKSIRKKSESHALIYGKLSGRISNILSCLSLVRLYSRDKDEKRKFSDLSNGIEKIETAIDKKMNLIEPLQEVIVLMVILLLISAMAFMFIKENGPNELGGFLVFFYLLKKAQTYFGALNSMKASLAALTGPMSVILQIADDKDKFFVSGGKVKFSGLKNGIKFDNLNFSYDKNARLLKNISLFVVKNETTAIIGPTGSGKTTLINLILRFYDCPPSSIFINDIDIRDYILDSLRAGFAVVSQDTWLFNDTLRNNITYGLDRHISEEEIYAAIEKARLHDFVVSLPDKLDTYIGDIGVRLSGGERQRVAIARAILKKAEILILDEATSSLDMKTEKLIQEAIDEIIGNKTVIVIAHRLSTIKNADKIVMIDKGEIVENGTSNELFAKKGKFYQYCDDGKLWI